MPSELCFFFNQTRSCVENESDMELDPCNLDMLRKAANRCSEFVYTMLTW